MHVGALGKIARRADIGVAERLEIGDTRRTQSGLLGRREPEEQLGIVWDQLGARNVGRNRHLLREAPPAFETTADKAAAHAGPAEDLQLLEQLPCGPLDVIEPVASQEHGDIVLFEDRRLRVAREADRFLEHAHTLPPFPGGTPIEREMASGLARHEAVKVGQPPGNGDAETGRSRLELALQPAKCGLELLTRLPELGCGLPYPQLCSRDLVVERRHEHLDVVVAHDSDAVQDVLLGLQDSAYAPLRCGREPIDELVDAGNRETTGCSAAEELLPGQTHYYAEGCTRTSPRIMRSRLATTSACVYGATTCSLRV